MNQIYTNFATFSRVLLAWRRPSLLVVLFIHVTSKVMSHVQANQANQAFSCLNTAANE